MFEEGKCVNKFAKTGHGLGDIGCEKGKKRVQNTTSLSKINKRKAGPAHATRNKMTLQ